MTSASIKGIIFDLGSTLLEYENRSWFDVSYDGQSLAYGEMKHLNHQLPDFETFNNRLEEIKNQLRKKALDTLIEWNAANAPARLFTELGIKNSEDEGRKFIDIFFRKVREQTTIIDGARQTLSEIKRSGYKTGLISNTIFAGYLHEGDIERFSIKEYLDFRIYSSEFGRRKPHPKIFKAGLEKIGLKPEETIYIGDRLNEDIEGPRSVGMGAILKYRKGREYPNPLPSDVPVVYELNELLDILKIN